MDGECSVSAYENSDWEIRSSDFLETTLNLINLLCSLFSLLLFSPSSFLFNFCICFLPILLWKSIFSTVLCEFYFLSVFLIPSLFVLLSPLPHQGINHPVLLFIESRLPLSPRALDFLYLLEAYLLLQRLWHFVHVFDKTLLTSCSKSNILISSAEWSEHRGDEVWVSSWRSEVKHNLWYLFGCAVVSCSLIGQAYLECRLPLHVFVFSWKT